MKRTLLLTLLGLFTSIGTTQAQCTPDPSVIGTLEFFKPLPLSNLPDGSMGVPYDESVTVYLLDSMTFLITDLLPFPPPGVPSSLTLPVAEVILVSSVPVAGMTGLCDPAGCVYQPGDLKCFGVVGTPTEFGDFTVTGFADYTVTIDATTSALLFGLIAPGPFNLPTPLIYLWFLHIDEFGLNVDENEAASAFNILPNVPNPANASTTISFNSLESADMEFALYDLSGNMIEQRTITSNQGINSFELATDALAPGVYFYSLSNGGSRLTEQIVITR
ncbi:MAG: hypothetical protein ACI837_002002 [Crocinitomicaceae bacterium]|jgi:hypothetical protein